MSRPSVVCLSSVTLVHLRQRLQLFGNVFAPQHFVVNEDGYKGSNCLSVKIIDDYFVFGSFCLVDEVSTKT